MSDYTRDDFTVTIAQRRLLAAIAAYGADLGDEGQAAVLSAPASGMVARLSQASPSDTDVVAIGAGLGELILAVAHERLDLAESVI